MELVWMCITWATLLGIKRYLVIHLRPCLHVIAIVCESVFTQSGRHCLAHCGDDVPVPWPQNTCNQLAWYPRSNSLPKPECQKLLVQRHFSVDSLRHHIPPSQSPIVSAIGRCSVAWCTADRGRAQFGSNSLTVIGSLQQFV